MSQGNALQYGDRQEPLFKSVTSIAKKSNKHENRVQILATKYQDRVFGSINNSPSFSSPSSFIENSNPVSLTIAMKLQPKRRYRKLKLPGVEGGSDDVANPIILPSHQVNSAVGLLLKRTGHINEIPSSRTRKPKYRVSSISVPSSKGTNRQQSALAKFEIRKQKTGLQSKPTEPTLLPIKLTSEKPPTPGSFHSSNKRKVKLDKKSMSLVGSLITAPPSDKSKLTIPKPIIDWSDRRHIQPNRPASSMATNRLKSAAGNDEIPSSSKKREFLYTGKVRSTPPYDHGSGPSCEPETLEGDGPDFVTFVAGGLLGYLCARNSARLSYTRESFSSSTHQNNSNFGKTYASTETETETKSGYATTKRR